MQSSTASNQSEALIDRMIRIAKLDRATFEEVEHDTTAMQQALTVVILAAVASGIGASASEGVTGVVLAPIAAILGWLLFSYVAYFVGTKMIPGPATEATPQELMRTLGFAQVPGLLAVFGIIPILGALIGVVGIVWGLIAAIIALKISLEASTGRAIAVGLISAVITGITIGLLLLPFGLAALAFG